jgi:hypothetical protein
MTTLCLDDPSVGSGTTPYTIRIAESARRDKRPTFKILTWIAGREK